MASGKKESSTLSMRGGSGLTGFMIGLIVAVAVAIPFASAVSFATHPQTQYLFSGRLSNFSQGGYTAFWWLIVIILGALPFLVGWAVTKLSPRALAIVGGIVVVLVIGAIVLGTIFVF